MLRRNNRLAVGVSKLRASTTGAFSHKRLDEVVVSLDPSGFQGFIDSYDAYYGYLNKATAGQSVLWLSYEDLCEDPRTVVGSICGHVGVEPPAALPKGIFKPQSYQRIRESVSTWDCLLRAFEHDERGVDFSSC